MDAVDVTIMSDEGANLRGWLRRPPDPAEASNPGPAALLIHGWGGCSTDMLPLSEPLLDAGLQVLLLDARGHGRSDETDVCSMPTFAEDVRTALSWLRNQPEVDAARIVLVGHSVGAGACLFVAADDPDIAGIVSLASMASPRDFMADRFRGLLPGALARLALGYIEHVIGHRFAEFSPIHTIGRTTAPVLLIHGALDATVLPSDAHRLHARAPDRSTLVVLPGADHTSVEALQRANATLLQFLRDASVASTTGNHRSES